MKLKLIQYDPEYPGDESRANVHTTDIYGIIPYDHYDYTKKSVARELAQISAGALLYGAEKAREELIEFIKTMHVSSITWPAKRLVLEETGEVLVKGDYSGMGE